MQLFFNNCRDRDHGGLFGAGAFYDLNCHGVQATMATNLRRGDECVVAARSTGGNIVFTWFRFSHETMMPDEKGIGVRVLFGERLGSETLRQQEAVKTEPYSVYFNINGDFKRRSVVEPRTPAAARRALGRPA